MTVCGTCRLGGGGAVWLVSPWGLGPVFFPCGSFVSRSCCRLVGVVWVWRSRALLPRSSAPLCPRVVAEVLDRKYCLELQCYFVCCHDFLVTIIPREFQ